MWLPTLRIRQPRDPSDYRRGGRNAPRGQRTDVPTVEPLTRTDAVTDCDGGAPFCGSRTRAFLNRKRASSVSVTVQEMRRPLAPAAGVRTLRPGEPARRAAPLSHRRGGAVVGHVRTSRRAPSGSLPHLRVRPRHLRPGDVAAVARPRSVHHRARARGVRSSRQRHPAVDRALLPTRCRPALLVDRADRRAGEWCVRGVPARARSRRRPVARVRARNVYLLHPTSQWLVWEFFHPDAVSIGPLLFAYWAARSGAGTGSRWRPSWRCLQGRRRARSRRDRLPHRVAR